MGGVVVYCMKCGREVAEEQVFCPDCLAQMEQEPIALRAPVKIPRQPPRTNRPRRPAIHYEEEVHRLEKSNEALRAWVLLLVMATILLAMAVYHKEVVDVVEELGKNYSIVETRYGPR